MFSMLLLIWMTTTAPLLQVKQSEEKAASIALAEETSGPVSGTNEDRSNTGISEYLSDQPDMSLLNPDPLKHNTCENGLISFACYRELLSPPPEHI